MNDPHMTDKEMDAVMRMWMQEAPAGQPDGSRLVGNVVGRLGSTRRRRRRWWPLTIVHGRTTTSTALERHNGRPDPVPAFDDHTPSVTGRTHIMVSPAKAFAVGALVFAIGGAFLIARPFGPEVAGVPGAVADAAPEPPVEFTGTWCIGPAVAPDRAGTETTVEVGDEGMSLTRNRGGAWRNTVTMSDPRLQGDAYQTYEGDTYSLPGTATGPGVIASTLSIVNEDGAWVSATYRATDADGTEKGDGPNFFIGEGAYEGLIAVMDSHEVGECADVQGVIFDGAPVPEPYRPE